MSRLLRSLWLLPALVAALLLAATAAGKAKPHAILTCDLGGRTTVSGIPAQVNHLRFQWWYADGSTHTSMWIAPAPDGTAWIPTWQHATRATADLHYRGRWHPYRDGRVLEVSARCR